MSPAVCQAYYPQVPWGRTAAQGTGAWDTKQSEGQWLEWRCGGRSRGRQVRQIGKRQKEKQVEAQGGCQTGGGPRGHPSAP